MLFPLFLSGMGIGILTIGVQWQAHSSEWRDTLIVLMPELLRAALHSPLALTVLASTVAMGIAWAYERMGMARLSEIGETPINTDELTLPQFTVQSMRCDQPDNPAHDGLKLTVSGTKMPAFVFGQAQLRVEGDAFWRVARMHFGSFPVSLFLATTSGRITLCPHYMTTEHFVAGQTQVNATVIARRTLKSIPLIVLHAVA
jgi:hypothetical protein